MLLVAERVQDHVSQAKLSWKCELWQPKLATPLYWRSLQKKWWVTCQIKLFSWMFLCFDYSVIYLGCYKYKRAWFWWLLFKEGTINGNIWKRIWKTISNSRGKYSRCISWKGYHGKSKEWNWKNCSLPHSVIRKNWCHKRLYSRFVHFLCIVDEFTWLFVRILLCMDKKGIIFGSYYYYYSTCIKKPLC